MKPLSLNELFDKDPTKLTDEEIDLMISKFREGRAQWAREESEARTAGRRPSIAKGTAHAKKSSVDIEVEV